MKTKTLKPKNKRKLKLKIIASTHTESSDEKVLNYIYNSIVEKKIQDDKLRKILYDDLVFSTEGKKLTISNYNL